ncbi:MAG: Uncharacterised protein [Hyphomonas sp. TMED17]|nr:MAG: Uncharacterised protein [Hyphomonas sp. TMED17]
MIAVGPLQCGLNSDTVFLTNNENRFRYQTGPRGIEMLHEGCNAALIGQFDFIMLSTAKIFELDADAGIEKGQLAQSVLECFPVEVGHCEGGRRDHEADSCAGIGRVAIFSHRTVTDCFKRRVGSTAINKPDPVRFAVPMNR